MKVRTGFVSNSSSSSYICEICGRSAAGWDMSPDEAEMVICKEGHLFCSHHMPCDAFTKEVVIAYINNMLSLSDTEKTAIVEYLQAMDAKTYEECTVGDTFVDMNDDSIINTVFGETELSRFVGTKLSRYEIEECIPSEFCPICKLDVVPAEDALRYLCAKNDMSMNEITAEIRDKFASCKELVQWLSKIESQHVKK